MRIKNRDVGAQRIKGQIKVLSTTCVPLYPMRAESRNGFFQQGRAAVSYTVRWSLNRPLIAIGVSLEL